MVAAVVLPADLQLVRSLVLPGQRRVHMKKECEPRKRLIADTIAGSSVEAVILTRATVMAANSTHGERACRP